MVALHVSSEKSSCVTSGKPPVSTHTYLQSHTPHPVPAAFLLWGFQSPHNRAAQVALLLVPRLLIVIVSYMATSSFLVWIMFHKEEPKDWSLSDFMEPHLYPSVSA